jgi:hypothetical protein
MWRTRPDPVRWLYYAFGGRLGPRFSQWVLHDLTSRTWMVRHLCRTLVQCSPTLGFLAVPIDLSVRLMMIGLVLFGGLHTAVAFAWEFRNHRLYKHGFIPELVLSDDRDDKDE